MDGYDVVKEIHKQVYLLMEINVEPKTVVLGSSNLKSLENYYSLPMALIPFKEGVVYNVQGKNLLIREDKSNEELVEVQGSINQNY